MLTQLQAETPTETAAAAQPGPQMALLACPISEIFFGGARGGGKTYAILLDWVRHSAKWAEHAQGIVFRRTYKELEEVVKTARVICNPIGGKVVGQELRMPNGAVLKFRHLLRDSDADDYQGHQYCVAEGTTILMADGTARAIEQVAVGDSVWTLEGAKRVTATIAPYVTPCVEAVTAFGSQVHPTTHPVLTAWGWQSYASALETDSKESVRTNQEPGRPLSVSVAARLSRPDLERRSRLLSKDPSTSPQRHGIFLRLWEESRAFRGLVLAGRPRQQELLRLVRDLFPGLCGVSYEQLGLETAGGFQSGCYWADYQCDESPPSPTDSGHDDIPTLTGAASPSQTRCTWDELGSIRECIPAGGEPYVHPYSGEVRHPTEASYYGACEMTPCGDRRVFDLTVEGANHYITCDTRLINRNSFMAFDEITNWASRAPLAKVGACLRSAVVAPQDLRYIATGNPGGPGHNWVKARYIDPARPYEVIKEYDEDVGGHKSRVFIPSLLADNPALAENDPMYLSRLKDSGPDWLVKAWIAGDWNIVAGGMFDDVLDTSTPHEHKGRVWGYGSKCAPFRIPSTWKVDRGFDWGSSAPFAVAWFAQSDGTEAVAEDGRVILVPRGTIFMIHEWYGWKEGQPNVGLRMRNADIAKGIVERDKIIEQRLLSGQKVKPGPADSAIYSAEDGVSIADKMAAEKCKWVPADKRPGSRVAGWQAIRDRFKDSARPIIEAPGLIIFDTCRQFWRTVPVLPRDDKRIDDVDTTTEDHIGDLLRYRVMNVPRDVTVRSLKGL